MNSYEDQPAFPATQAATLKGAAEWSGMTRREHLAAVAMQGVIASGNYSDSSYGEVAFQALHYADALIELFEME
tara:strand:- start:746 stop:967 length:222 start_codon:yes stop_codon:yes gene_type:complete